MKTMPRITLRFMRFLVERMLTRIIKWEDLHASEDHPDYRMSELYAGLWRASRAMREILDGNYNPMRKNDQVGTVGQPWDTEPKLTPEYLAEMFGDASVPLRPVN